jgi:hypothetical protein
VGHVNAADSTAGAYGYIGPGQARITNSTLLVQRSPFGEAHGAAVSNADASVTVLGSTLLVESTATPTQDCAIGGSGASSSSPAASCPAAPVRPDRDRSAQATPSAAPAPRERLSYERAPRHDRRAGAARAGPRVADRREQRELPARGSAPASTSAVATSPVYSLYVVGGSGEAVGIAAIANISVVTGGTSNSLPTDRVFRRRVRLTRVTSGSEHRTPNPNPRPAAWGGGQSRISALRSRLVPPTAPPSSPSRPPPGMRVMWHRCRSNVT